MNHKVKHY